MAKNTRLNVAVHEAGHLIIGRQLGFRGAHAIMISDTRGRNTDSWFAGSALDEAVHILAGAAAGRLITGDPALDGTDDIARAHRVLADTGHSFRDAERKAATLARKHRRDIEKAAQRLYNHGRI